MQEPEVVVNVQQDNLIPNNIEPVNIQVEAVPVLAQEVAPEFQDPNIPATERKLLINIEQPKEISKSDAQTEKFVEHYKNYQGHQMNLDEDSDEGGSWFQKDADN